MKDCVTHVDENMTEIKFKECIRAKFTPSNESQQGICENQEMVEKTLWKPHRQRKYLSGKLTEWEGWEQKTSSV